MRQYIIENKNINVYYNQKSSKKLPVIILNSHDNEGTEVFNKCISIMQKEFILISISGLNWNNDLTPWEYYMEGRKKEIFAGKANKYLEILTKKIIPKIQECINIELNLEIEYYVIAGYSLAGLFALYAGYKTDIFSKIICASGSLWYPGVIEYIKENDISKNINKIYFSLGNKESKVSNKILQSVEERTKEIEKMLRQKGIETIFVENEGNHFTNSSLRIANGIKWTIE